MKALWQKDRWWMWTMVVVGAVVLALGVAERGFIHVFVLAPGRLEAAFYVAAVAGSLLGVLSIVWDDLLGTREFLVQRPVARRALARSPLLACGMVLLAWMVLVPILAWVFAAFYSGIFAPTFWVGVPEILATLCIAWPACAVGCVAAALPAAWWLRLLLLGTLVVTVGIGIDAGSQGGDGYSDMPLFVGLCALAVAVMVPLVVYLHGRRADADRPWPVAVRFGAGLLLAVTAAYSINLLAGQAQLIGIRRVQTMYPRIERLDGGVVLARRDPDRRRFTVCNEDHVPVGPSRPREDFENVRYSVPRDRLTKLEIEAPLWHPYGRGVWAMNARVHLWIDHRGHVWSHSYWDGTIVRSGVGAQLDRFPTTIEVHRVDDVALNKRWPLVCDSVSGRVWRYDVGKGYFVEHPLPDGDRYRESSTLRGSSVLDALRDIPLLASLFDRQSSLTHIQGEKATYAMKDGVWVPFDAGRRATKPKLYEAKVLASDALFFSVEVTTADGSVVLSHEFYPRTFWERLHAAHVMFWSAVRPPAAQVASSVFGDATPDVFAKDPLLLGGRRLWLLFTCLGVAVFSALMVWRRLRRIGAGVNAQRFWVVTTVAIGPLGIFLATVCEPQRAHARPPLATAKPPRISALVGSAANSSEVHA